MTPVNGRLAGRHPVCAIVRKRDAARTSTSHGQPGTASCGTELEYQGSGPVLSLFDLECRSSAILIDTR